MFAHIHGRFLVFSQHQPVSNWNTSEAGYGPGALRIGYGIGDLH
jgi:hypothetical protein